jgi:hypothetical protein
MRKDEKGFYREVKRLPTTELEIAHSRFFLVTDTEGVASALRAEYHAREFVAR